MIKVIIGKTKHWCIKNSKSICCLGLCKKSRHLLLPPSRNRWPS